MDARGVENIFVQGRLKPGVSYAHAQASMNELAAQLEREYPDDNEGKRITLSPPGLIGNSMRGPVLGFAGLLMVIVGLVLLLACINLANLLLARAAERRREIAVRLAMGASRSRLIRQLLTESVVLALMGGALGLVLALRLAALVVAVKVPVDVPLALNVAIDTRVFLFALLISLATGVLFGLLPAWQATKTDLVSALKDEPSFGGYRRSWLKNSLIVLQVALSLVLLVGGGLMLRALQQAQTIHLGFNPERAVEVSFDLRLQGYEDARGREFQKHLLERVRALPGVQFASLADSAPVDLHFSRDKSLHRRPAAAAQHAGCDVQSRDAGILSGNGYSIGPGPRLHRTGRPERRAGRHSQRNFRAPLLSRRRPDRQELSHGSPELPKRQVIGVVEDGKYAGLNEDPKPYVVRPLWQSYSGSTIVIVRAAADAQKLIASIRDEVRQLDPNLPVASRTLTERMSLPLLPARIAAWVLGIFGMLALALVAIGLYGVMSYAVSKRTREIGIRMALGAQRADVMRLVIGQGLTLVLIGMGIGLVAAIALTQSMKALLFGVSATDPLTYVGVGLLLAGVALLACYLPSRRAAKVDPMIALRYE